MDQANLLNWYQSYFDLTHCNRLFVVFYRNDGGWPQRSFYESEAYTRDDAAKKATMPKYYSQIIPCRIENGAAVPLEG